MLDICAILRKLKVKDWHILEKIINEVNLGSYSAAFYWLVFPNPDFGKSPIEMVAEGKGNIVLADLESQHGPSPTYS